MVRSVVWIMILRTGPNGAGKGLEASGLPAIPGSEIYKTSQCFWPSTRLVDTMGKLHKDETLYLHFDVQSAICASRQGTGSLLLVQSLI
jgi:hypothetical protein